MAGPEIRDAAVQGSQKIAHALKGVRLRFAIYLVQISLDG